MSDVTYTIYNNSTNTTATINYFEIQSDVSKLQHRLKIPVTWNSPFNSSPYTNLTSSTTLTLRAKNYLDHVSNINYETTAVTTSTVLYLESNSSIELGWSVFNQDYIYGTQTVVNLIGTQTVVMSSAPDVVPFGSGETITFIPPEYYLDLNNTTDLQPGWAAFGNGYNGETILTVTSSTRVIMSDQPATTPTTGSIVFKSLNDVMLQIPPMSNNTFNMDYDRITSVVGSYRSTVTMYAILGTLVSKVVNNYMTVSTPAPAPPAPSPYYDPSSPVPPAPPPINDTGSSSTTGAPPPAPGPDIISTEGVGGGGGLTTETTTFDDGSTLSITTNDSGQVVSITSTPSTDTGPGGGSPCYLTTAATIYYNKDDKCNELQSARALREIALSKHPRNKIFVELYYKIAPVIVQRKHQWEDVYEDTLVPLVDLYKDGKYDDAIKLYKREIGKLIGQYITYKDREIIEFTFDKLFKFKKLPYMLKVAVLRILLWYQMTFRL